jgi:hypothetical protein
MLIFSLDSWNDGVSPEIVELPLELLLFTSVTTTLPFCSRVIGVLFAEALVSDELSNL